MSRKSLGINRAPTRVTAAGTTALTLTQAEHADQTVVQDVICTGASMTYTLPKSEGNGDTYRIVNNAVQTVSLVVAALTTDIMSGVAVMLEQAGGTDDVVFYTTATSDKATLNATTTGGLRGDIIECIDLVPGTWLVRATLFPSGDVVTPFAAS